jgi:hypothetical protein
MRLFRAANASVPLGITAFSAVSIYSSCAICDRQVCRFFARLFRRWQKTIDITWNFRFRSGAYFFGIYDAWDELPL